MMLRWETVLFTDPGNTPSFESREMIMVIESYPFKNW